MNKTIHSYEKSYRILTMIANAVKGLVNYHSLRELSPQVLGFRKNVERCLKYFIFLLKWGDTKNVGMSAVQDQHLQGNYRREDQKESCWIWYGQWQEEFVQQGFEVWMIWNKNAHLPFGNVIVVLIWKYQYSDEFCFKPVIFYLIFKP